MFLTALNSLTRSTALVKILTETHYTTRIVACHYDTQDVLPFFTSLSAEEQTHLCKHFTCWLLLLTHGTAYETVA